jgi:hypothetical protein
VCHWYDDRAGMRRVRERTGVPVTGGQSEVSKYGCQALVRGGAVDILNVDVSHAGGITEWRKIAAMAEMAGVAMAHHEEPHLSQHCLGVIKFGLYPEYFSAIRDPIGWHLPKHLPPLQDGRVSIPQTPGFGLELSQEFIERHRLRSAWRHHPSPWPLQLGAGWGEGSVPLGQLSPMSGVAIGGVTNGTAIDELLQELLRLRSVSRGRRSRRGSRQIE